MQTSKLIKLVEPNDVADATRNDWIEKVYTNFISSSTANKSYYKVILETLWPENHGIPGPHIHEREIRAAIDKFRQAKSPYRDPFRRVRELQGEEGVVGIAKEGQIYQLINLSIANKRIPREKLSNKDWQFILERYSFQCAVCGRREPEVKFDQDHKIPRTRQGGNNLENWQPLCVECNNFKSTACRGCTLDCHICSWAFPEKFAPLRLSTFNIERIRKLSKDLGINHHDFANQIIDEYFNGLQSN